MSVKYLLHIFVTFQLDRLGTQRTNDNMRVLALCVLAVVPAVGPMLQAKHLPAAITSEG
jgi:hypothetical protein